MNAQQVSSPELNMASAWLWLVAALLSTANSSRASPALNETTRADYTGHQLVSVVPTTALQVRELSTLVNTLELDVWHESTLVGESALLRLRPDVVGLFAETTLRIGLNVTTMCKNLQEVIDTERRQMRFTTYSTTPLRFQRYLKYTELKNALKQYAKKHDHVQYTSIGRSFEGRNIIAAHIKVKDNLPIVFLDCGIHAREWISHSACLYIIDQLATLYDSDETIRRLVSTYEWRIHPVVNPDGYEFTHTSDRLWRKTRSKSRRSIICRGADANRNFDIGGFCRVQASTNPCSERYCGDSAFSEPETRAIREALRDTQGRTKFYFSLHSYGQLWMFPYAYSYSPVSEYEQLLNISMRATEAIKRVKGTVYKVGPIATTIYQTSGSSVDWAYERAGVTKSFALELQPSKRYFDLNAGFLLPAEDIFPTVVETWEGIKAAVS